MLQKNTGLQGSTLSGPRMTTGFGPFELPTRGLLQKGREEGVVVGQKYCLEEVTRKCCITKMAVPPSIKRASSLVRKCAGGVVVSTRYESHSCTDKTR